MLFSSQHIKHAKFARLNLTQSPPLYIPPQTPPLVPIAYLQVDSLAFTVKHTSASIKKECILHQWMHTQGPLALTLSDSHTRQRNRYKPSRTNTPPDWELVQKLQDQLKSRASTDADSVSFDRSKRSFYWNAYTAEPTTPSTHVHFSIN